MGQNLYFSSSLINRQFLKSFSSVMPTIFLLKEHGHGQILTKLLVVLLFNKHYTYHKIPI